MSNQLTGNNTDSTVNASKSSLSVSPNIISANNTDIAVITFTAKNAAGDIITILDAADVKIMDGSKELSTTKQSPGVFTTSFTTDAAGQIPFHVKVNNNVISGLGTFLKINHTQEQLLDLIDATNSTLVANPNSISADDSDIAKLVFTPIDNFGDKVRGLLPASFNWAVTGLGAGNFTLDTTPTSNDGEIIATLKGNQAGTATVSITAGAADSLNKSVDITLEAGHSVADVDKAHSTLIPSPPSVGSDDVTSVTITFTAKDISGLPISDLSETVIGFTATSSTLAAEKFSLINFINHRDGTYSKELRGSAAGTVNVNVASVIGMAPCTVSLNDAAQLKLISTLSADKSSLSEAPQNINADGVATSTITFTAKDVQGNAVIGLSKDSVGFHLLNQLADADYTLGPFSDNTNGTYNIKLSGTVPAAVMINVSCITGLTPANVILEAYKGTPLTCDYPLNTKAVLKNDSTFNGSDATAPIKGGNHGTLTCISSNPTVATIESGTNNLVLQGYGTTTITVTEAAHGAFLEQHLDYYLQVKHPIILQMPATPVVVAQVPSNAQGDALNLDKFKVTVIEADTKNPVSGQIVTLTQGGAVVYTTTTNALGEASLKVKNADGIHDLDGAQEADSTGTVTLAETGETQSINLHYVKKIATPADQHIQYQWNKTNGTNISPLATTPGSLGFSSPTNGEVTCTSTDSSIVSVTSNGSLTCHKTGTVTIHILQTLNTLPVYDIPVSITVYDNFVTAYSVTNLTPIADSATPWPVNTTRRYSIIAKNHWGDTIAVEDREYKAALNMEHYVDYGDNQYHEAIDWDSKFRYQTGFGDTKTSGGMTIHMLNSETVEMINLEGLRESEAILRITNEGWRTIASPGVAIYTLLKG